MRFTRDHTHNGTRHEKGEPYTGGIGFARFLYQRGILEPDGHTMDPHVTVKRPDKSAWHSGDETLDKPTKGKKAKEK